jgi:hypothetical protein
MLDFCGNLMSVPYPTIYPPLFVTLGSSGDKKPKRGVVLLVILILICAFTILISTLRYGYY